MRARRPIRYLLIGQIAVLRSRERVVVLLSVLGYGWRVLLGRCGWDVLVDRAAVLLLSAIAFLGVFDSVSGVVGLSEVSLAAVDPSVESDGDSGSGADESVSSDASVEDASPLADGAFDDVFDDEDVEADPDADVEADLLDDEESPVDDEGADDDWPVDDVPLVDEEPPVDDPDGSAYAMPGVVAMATPTPRVTANAPTRPMCLAYPMTVPLDREWPSDQEGRRRAPSARAFESNRCP